MMGNVRIKRVLACLLSMALVLTYSMPVSVFASTSEAPYEENKAVIEHNGEVVTASGVEIQKTIKKVDGVDNTFDITLDVKSEKLPQADLGDVVIVFDNSGSMESINEGTATNPNYKNHSEKLTAAQNAAKKLGDALIDKGSRVAVVTFSKDAVKRCDFTDNKGTFNSAINTFKSEKGGTFMQAGLKMAQDMLENGGTIVLISDGAPTITYMEKANTVSAAKLEGTDLSYADDAFYTLPSGAKTGDYTAKDVALQHYAFGFDYYDYELGFGHDNRVGSTDYNNMTIGSTKAPKYDCGYNENGTEIYMKPGNHGYATIGQAFAAKQQGIEIYSIGYDLAHDNSGASPAVCESVLKNIATDAEHFFKAECTVEKENGKTQFNFKSIDTEIEKVTNGIISSAPSAWTVTDPMGDLIVLDRSSLADRTDVALSLDRGTGRSTIFWTPALDKNDEGIFEATLTYRIKINVEDPTFRCKTGDAKNETGIYPTNGVTTLTYNGGKTLEFDVPKVSGHAEVNGSVEYYKLDTATGTYPDEPNQVKYFTANIHTDVLLSTIDPSYESAFGSLYTCVTATEALKLTSINPENNVLRVYFTPKDATVVTEHYYKVIEKNAKGEEKVIKEIGTEPDRTSTDVTYAGIKYVSTPETSYDTLPVVKSTCTSGNSTIDELPLGTTTIKWEYEVIKEVAQAELIVQVQLNQGVWKLTNGKYAIHYPEGTPEVKSDLCYEVGTSQNINIADFNKNGYEVAGWTSTNKSGASEANGVITQQLAKGKTTVTIKLNIAPEAKEEKTVTIGHTYTLTTVTGNEKGELVKTEAKPEKKVTTAAGLVGEVVTIAANNYGVFTEADLTAESKAKLGDFTIKENNNDNVVLLDYEKEITKEADITIEHEYYDFTLEFDENNEIIGGDWQLTEKSELQGISYTDNEIVGMTYSAKAEYQNPVNNKYYLTNPGDASVSVSEDSSENVIILKFYNSEDAKYATVNVNHIYTTYVIEAKNGTPIQKEKYTNTVSEAGIRIGMTYEITPDCAPAYETAYSVKSYGFELKKGQKLNPVVANAAPTFDIYYERTIEAYQPAFLAVLHKYTKKIVEVVGGIVKSSNNYSEDTTFTVDGGNSIPASLYAGETYKIDQKPTYVDEEYTPTGDVQSITLKAGNNAVSYEYTLEEAPDLVPLHVNHYKVYTYIDENGVERNIEDDPITKEQEYYVDQAVTVKPLETEHFSSAVIDGIGIDEDFNGYDAITHEYHFAIQGETTVNYTYVYVTDHSKANAATVIINHHYMNEYAAGVEEEDHVVTAAATGFGGELLPITAKEEGDWKYNDDRTFATGGISGTAAVLVKGENVVDLYYEKDCTDQAVLTVHHNYYLYDTARRAVEGEVEGLGVLQGTEMTTIKYVKVGEDYTIADPNFLYDFNGRTYKLADGNVYTINISPDADLYEMTINYRADYSSYQPSGGGGGGHRPSNNTTEELEDIQDEEVPLSDLPTGDVGEEEFIIEDEAVPLADLPATGGMGVGLFLLLGAALAGAGFGLRRKED